MGIDFVWLWLGLAFGCLALYAWIRSVLIQREVGLPQGNVIFDDVGEWRENQRTLVSRGLMLAGKPDYIVKQYDGGLIPVEVKSSVAPRYPYPGHLMQLAAYCALVQDEYRQRPAYGIIQYKNKAFAIEYTDELEGNLIATLEDMREAEFEPEVYREHEQVAKCRKCGMREVCDQRLS